LVKRLTISALAANAGRPGASKLYDSESEIVVAAHAPAQVSTIQETITSRRWASTMEVRRGTS